MLVTAIARCGCAALVALGALLAAAPSAAATVTIRPGDRVTQTALLAFEAWPPKPGDWVRYRTTIGRSWVDQTIGFGSELVDGRMRPFVELEIAAKGIINSPVQLGPRISGAALAKTYLDADAIDDVDRSYPVLATVLKVGDSLYLFDYRKPQSPTIAANAPPPTFSLLRAFLPETERQGSVVDVSAQDVPLRGSIVHTARITALFAPLLGGAAPPVSVAAWQSAQVPLGTVAVRALVGGRELDVDLIDYGIGTYVPRIKEKLSDIPPLPGPH